MLAHNDQDNIIFLCKVAHGIQVNIAQVTLMCNAGTCRLRQHCIGSFPAKKCLYAPGQHYTSSYLVQCCLRRVWTTLNGQYCILSQHGRYNIAQVIFLIKVACLPWANIAQVISLCNFGPERSGHHCRLFSSAKLFVDCAMIGREMIDPLAAGK